MSHIEFRVIDHKPKTEVWGVFAKSSGDRLGQIAWYSPWRQYVFMPMAGTVWSDGCLADVRTRVRRANTEHPRKS